jgi:hypothetical protein
MPAIGPVPGVAALDDSDLALRPGSGPLPRCPVGDVEPGQLAQAGHRGIHKFGFSNGGHVQSRKMYPFREHQSVLNIRFSTPQVKVHVHFFSLFTLRGFLEHLDEGHPADFNSLEFEGIS